MAWKPAPARPTSLRCPKCGKKENGVTDSRPISDGASIQRRRFCHCCGHKWKTLELGRTGISLITGALATVEALQNENRLAAERLAKLETFLRGLQPPEGE